MQLTDGAVARAYLIFELRHLRRVPRRGGRAELGCHELHALAVEVEAVMAGREHAQVHVFARVLVGLELNAARKQLDRVVGAPSLHAYLTRRVEQVRVVGLKPDRLFVELERRVQVIPAQSGQQHRVSMARARARAKARGIVRWGVCRLQRR